MLLANIMLVLWDWDEIKILINKTPVMDAGNRLEKMKIWEITGLALFIFTSVYRLSVTGYNIFLWFSVCMIIGITGLVIGVYRYKKFSIK